jgi:Zn-dependent peptidase ImmA (M78 family)
MKQSNIPKWMKTLEKKTNDMLKFLFDEQLSVILNTKVLDSSVLADLCHLKKSLEELKNYELKKENFGYTLQNNPGSIEDLTNKISEIDTVIQNTSQLILNNGSDNDAIDLVHLININQYPNKTDIELEQNTTMMPLYQDYLDNITKANIVDGQDKIPLVAALQDVDLSSLANDKLYELEDSAFSYLSQVVDFKTRKARLLCERDDASVLDMSVIDNKTSSKAILALQAAIKDSLPQTKKAKDYLFSKVEGINLKNQRIRNVTIDDNLSKLKIPYKEGIKIVKKSFSLISKDMSDFVDFMDQHSLIEYYSYPEKGSGASAANYQTISNFSVVLLNYQDDIKSVITLAHELGHAYHHSKLSDIKSHDRYYPLIFAETASMFAETLILDSLMKTHSGSESLDSIRLERVVKAFDLMIMVPSRFDLEEQIYTLKEKNSLTQESLRSTSKENTLIWYGKSDGIENPNDWMLTRHYFMPDSSFYNYPYYFGYLLNSFLLNQRDENGFDIKFENFLKRTGESDARKVLLDCFFVDIESKDFWISAISKIIDTLNDDIKYIS